MIELQVETKEFGLTPQVHWLMNTISMLVMLLKLLMVLFMSQGGKLVGVWMILNEITVFFSVYIPQMVFMVD